MRFRPVILSLAAAAAAAGPIAGCGSSSSSPNAAQSGGTPSQASPSKPSAVAHAVTIANFKFSPAAITVSRGTKLTITNNDSTAHTATADDGNSFDTGDINPQSAATITLSKAGTFKYHCSIHPFMHGTLVVK